MKLVLFCHSLRSDWNHGNAHFLRGVVRALQRRGIVVDVYEPAENWSRRHLLAEHGPAADAGFRAAYPDLSSIDYDPATVDLDATLDGADLVIVHEWSEPGLVARLGAHRTDRGQRKRYRLLFLDTHHRAATAPHEMARYDLSGFDGVLAFGTAIRQLYLARGWARRAWTWHEAADTDLFRPLPADKQRDLVWIGNWGDDERSAELNEFLIEPVRQLGLDAMIHGVRYPAAAQASLAAAGIRYGGYLPNVEVPAAFARARLTVHVPRRPYAAALPGIPTIRVFEALAAGIPLVSAPWDDAEGLFDPGLDFRVARDGAAMTRHLDELLNDPVAAAEQAARGRATVLRRHTCTHRVAELLAIAAELGVDPPAPSPLFATEPAPTAVLVMAAAPGASVSA